jgi:hypothetical protein
MSDLRLRRRSIESLARVDVKSLDRLRSVVRLLKKDDSINALLESCNKIGEAYLFGGLVRDALIGSAGVFGDVDIFVSGPLDSEFAEHISRIHRRTNFGGMRLVVGRFDVDIWELAKSQAFRFERGADKSIKGLLSTVCFSTDAVAVSLVRGNVLADASFNRTLQTRVFEFVSKPTSLEILQVVRIARIFIKNSVRPNIEVCRYFADGVDAFGIDGLVEAEQKWKGRRLLDERLVSLVDQWCRFSMLSGRVSERPEFGVASLFPTELSARDVVTAS